MHHGRRLLLEVCDLLLRGQPVPTEAQMNSGLRIRRHAGPLAGDPERDAVLVVHQLDMEEPALHLWSAVWPPGGLENAAHRVAVAAARLLAAREDLQVLVAHRDPDGQCGGALVDAETCARIAIAGYDVETEMQLGNCQELLEVSGALQSFAAQRTRAPGPAGFLLLGIRH